MKKAVIFVLVAAVICSGLYIAFKRDFDQFNPLYKEEYVYSVVGEPAGVEGKFKRYRYNLTGRTASGEKKNITFSSGKELEQGAYVKVLAKGAYTKKWVIIGKEDVPNLALE
ncbi:YxeA family protein [Paenibacillus sp. TRM 82003]|nr:YxeA family protein [Paenibacillus sp. TRM 82003]